MLYGSVLQLFQSIILYGDYLYNPVNLIQSAPRVTGTTAHRQCYVFCPPKETFFPWAAARGGSPKRPTTVITTATNYHQVTGVRMRMRTSWNIPIVEMCTAGVNQAGMGRMKNRKSKAGTGTHSGPPTVSAMLPVHNQSVTVIASQPVISSMKLSTNLPLYTACIYLRIGLDWTLLAACISTPPLYVSILAPIYNSVQGD